MRIPEQKQEVAHRVLFMCVVYFKGHGSHETVWTVGCCHRMIFLDFSNLCADKSGSGQGWRPEAFQGAVSLGRRRRARGVKCLWR